MDAVRVVDVDSVVDVVSVVAVVWRSLCSRINSVYLDLPRLPFS